jgi:hypothetical protein
MRNWIYVQTRLGHNCKPNFFLRRIGRFLLTLMQFFCSDYWMIFNEIISLGPLGYFKWDYFIGNIIGWSFNALILKRKLEVPGYNCFENVRPLIIGWFELLLFKIWLYYKCILWLYCMTVFYDCILFLYFITVFYNCILWL